jgi:hypothetical protein
MGENEIQKKAKPKKDHSVLLVIHRIDKLC